jgi:methionine synthase II (cobalamin-independent)
VHYPDQTAFVQSWSSSFPSAPLENAWRCVADAFQVFHLNRFPVRHARWVYEHAFLYCARRDDGICLGIFTSKDPQAISPDEIERLIAQFLQLSAVAPA